MPVRVIKKNYRSVTGHFASLKNGRNVGYESLLERDLFLLLEFDTSVVSYEEQPISLFYRYSNRDIRYTPDVLLHYKDPNRLPCIYEIKYSDEIKEKKVFLKQKFEQIEAYLAKNDMEFKLFTELDIRTQFLENAKMIYGAISQTVPALEEYRLEQMKKVLQNEGRISIDEYMLKMSTNRYERAIYMRYLWHLIFFGHVKIDMNSKITNSSLIWSLS